MNVRRRKLYRIGMGTFFSLVVYFGGTVWSLSVLGFFLALLLFLEYERKLHPGLYGWITARAGGIFKEHTGFFLPDTYFVLSAFLVFAVFPLPVGLAALIFLTYGDAVSAVVGVNFGRHKIYRRKTLEGTTAFLITAIILAVAVSRLPRHQLPFSAGLAGAGVAALTELFSIPPDDNFSITILSGLAMFLTSRFI